MAPNTALKSAIFATGTSQIAIAQKTGIQESRLSRIVRGWLEPTPEEKKAIARVLHRPISQLFPSETAVAS